MLNSVSTASRPRRALVVVGLVGAMLVIPWTLVHAQDPIAPMAQSSQPKVGFDPLSKLTAKKPTAQPASADPLQGKPKASAPKAKAADPLKPPVPKVKKTPPSTAQDKPDVIVDPGKAGDGAALAKRIVNGLRAKYSASEYRVLLDLNSNLVLVRLDKRIRDEAVAWIKTIKPEKPATTSLPAAKQTTTIRLKYADAQAMAVTLSKIFAHKYTGADLMILSDPATNSLIVSAPRKITDEVFDQVAQLDRKPSSDPLSGTKEIRKFMLKHLDAAVGAKLIGERFKGDLLEFISYDPTDNSIVVKADAASMDEIGRQVRAIDQTS